MITFKPFKAGLTALALTACATPLMAQEQAQQPAAQQPAQQPAAQQPERPQAINRFDDGIVRMLLTDVGTSVEVLPGAENTVTRYRASTNDGVNFVVFPAACAQETGCVGLITVAIFDGLEVSDAASLDAFLHRFNDANPTAKVFRSPQGSVVLQSYINAANIITYRNAQSQLLVFGRDIVRTSRALLAFQNEGTSG